MLTGEIRGQINAIWDSFWSGGISNPIEVLDQLTYLLFIRRLDEAHTREESKANLLKQPMKDRVYPEGKDPKGRKYDDLRWSRFKNFSPSEMYTVVSEHVFPFLRTLGGDGSTYAAHMKDARFTIPTAALLAKVVDLLDQIAMDDRDTKGDVYEYMLGKIASAGQNGQFRTPRHIIRLMVEMTAPTPKDIICDPASGTCGFLVGAGEYLRETYPDLLKNAKDREHFHKGMFHGYDFDTTMLRIGSMNMALHGVDNPDIRYKDSLAQDHAGDEEKYSLILANPPFAGSLDYENTAKDLQSIVKTKKTELLFLALFLRLLKPGGRAAVIVPDGVLFGSSKAHKELRRMIVEDQKLDGIVKLPSGVFKPYAGVSTAILLFTKTNSGGTDVVWFYDMQADGWSLDDKRQPLLPPEKLGVAPKEALNPEDHPRNNLPDLLNRWQMRDTAERQNPRTSQSFCVPKADIVAQGYTNFEDELGPITTIDLPQVTAGLNMAKFKEKARQFLKAHESHISLQRLRRNQPLTATDLAELEKMLHDAGGSADLITQAKEQNNSLGLFIRSLVGLDREAAIEAFSGFLSGGTETADQIEFVNLIIDELTKNGFMDPGRLFEAPYVDIHAEGPIGIFPPQKAAKIVEVLNVIRDRAAA